MPNETAVQAENSTHVVQFTSRDWKVLFGPSIEDGNKLLALLGSNSFESIVVSRRELLVCTEKVLGAISKDAELLRYDYTFQFSGAGSRPPWCGSGTLCGFKIEGISKCIVAEPGHCYICEAVQPPQGQAAWGNLLDLRNRAPVVTDDWGTITVRRRNKGLCWPRELSSLIQFLERVPDETVTVLNQHR